LILLDALFLLDGGRRREGKKREKKKKKKISVQKEDFTRTGHTFLAVPQVAAVKCN
jgi:hypothetical protein